eukprot:scaffold347_cov380-Prasinococcus_capsulatus_cf.AAC.24
MDNSSYTSFSSTNGSYRNESFDSPLLCLRSGLGLRQSFRRSCSERQSECKPGTFEVTCVLEHWICSDSASCVSMASTKSRRLALYALSSLANSQSLPSVLVAFVVAPSQAISFSANDKPTILMALLSVADTMP